MARGLIAVFVLALASAGVAEEKHSLSVFVTNSEVSAAAFRDFGIAFTESWTPRFSTEFAISREEPELCVGGSFLNRPCTWVILRTHPIDVSGRYHFGNQTRWKPYAGIGIRYVRAPDLAPELIAEIGHDYRDHIDAQAVGGVEFLLNDSLGFFVDGKHLFAETERFDPRFKVSVGVNWHF